MNDDSKLRITLFKEFLTIHTSALINVFSFKPCGEMCAKITQTIIEFQKALIALVKHQFQQGNRRFTSVS